MSKTAIIESSFYGSKVKIANQHEMETRAKELGENFELVTPPELSVMSTEIMPSGLPIGSSAFIIDKIAVAFCDGKDHWYRKADQFFNSGQPWSVLF